MRPSTTQRELNLLDAWMMITVKKKKKMGENETDFTIPTLVKKSNHDNL